ncbi:hypothetical protein BS78_08G137300 [Paspalum vaginatum]|nr:hypothetical protein BS78_08G137300 [Paspalum vaginatum]
MGGLWSAMDWWDEWKLRILVLCSLAIQFLISFSTIIRGDAVAIYALATLFNRQKQQGGAGGAGSSSSSALEVIWLWKRHAITLVSQVTVALYVFCKWWSGEKKFLQAAVLLFVAGIIRFGEKPWALRRASFRAMAASTTTSRNLSRRRGPGGGDSSRWWGCGALRSCWACFFDTTTVAQRSIPQPEATGAQEVDDASNPLEEYVRKVRAHIKGAPRRPPPLSSSSQQLEDYKKRNLHHLFATELVHKLFLDPLVAYSVRLQCLQPFLSFDDGFLHTSTGTFLRGILECSIPALAVASLVLLAKSGKDGDIRPLLRNSRVCFTCLCLPCLVFFFIRVFSWQFMVSQHSVLSLCAAKMKPSAAMKLADLCCGLGDYIRKHRYVRHERVARRISELVRRHAEYGWKRYIRDPATYRRFNDLRGEHTLTLCSGREDLFLAACGDIIDMMMMNADNPPSPPPADDKRSRIAKRILGMEQGDDGLIKQASIISRAHRLAKQPPTDLSGEEERSEVIQGVCRGYEHARNLDHGGEYLTSVWLIWSCMGMEILQDNMHIPDPPITVLWAKPAT